MFIDDLPDAVQSAETFPYADHTTLYCIAETVDAAIFRLNRALAELRVWCNSNHLIPHPGKCRAMLMHRGNFTGPVQQLLLGDNIIEWTESERLLGVQVDHKLSWTNHAVSVAKAHAAKLNLLRRSQFLPTKQQEDFYFKVILPSVLYGLTVWGSSNNTYINRLEKLHARAGRIIYRLPWDISAEKCLRKDGMGTAVYHVQNPPCPVCVQSDKWACSARDAKHV